MAQTVVSIHMDEDLKHRFDAFCAEAEISMSFAMNMFARATLSLGQIPFVIEVNGDPFYSKKNQERIRAAIERLDAGGGVEHDIIEVEDDE